MVRLRMVLLVSIASAAPVALAQSSYSDMLGYLASSRIDGDALAGSQGAIAVNQAAGDFNLQANLRSIAAGGHADASAQALQWQHDSHAQDDVRGASASIGGNALRGAGGIASINQASGSRNVELNTVSAVLAAQGIREVADEGLAPAAAFASAGEQPPRTSGGPRGPRSVAVEATALRGFEGVLQLNQIAGSDNHTSNQIGISVQATP